jgi:hypothetical protein
MGILSGETTTEKLMYGVLTTTKLLQQPIAGQGNCLKMLNRL